LSRRQSIKLSSTGYSLLFVLTLGYAVYAMDRTVLSAVLPVMEQHLALSNTEVGYLGAAQYMGVLAIVFAAGRLSDIYGRKKILLLGVSIFTIFTMSIGAAPDFAWAFVLRLFSGIGEGFFWPVAMATVAQAYGHRKGASLGVFYVGFDVGSISGVFVGGLTYSLLGSWRYSFFIAPLIGLAVVGALFFMENAPRIDVVGSVHQHPQVNSVKKWKISLLMFFAFLATWASVWQVVFLPYYFFKVMHFGVLSSAALSSLVLIAGGIGKVVLGRISDILHRIQVLIFCSLGVVVSYVVFFFASSFSVAFTGALCMGFLSSSVFPVMQALATDLYPEAPGTSLGLTTTAQSFATVLSPIIAGYLFFMGVGKALALDALVPSFLMTLVSFILITNQETAPSTRPI
jgi:ACS family hexuronate transporter-like MFS transporter